MINIETIEVSGFKGAIKGMRNPFKNRDKSDSGYTFDQEYEIGPKDLDLCQRLIRAGGDDDAKFMRYIHVQADVTAPLYWWKEFDTYKISTVANSESTMHTIHKQVFSYTDFSCDQLLDDYTIDEDWELEDRNPQLLLEDTVDMLNELRRLYLKSVEEKNNEKAKDYWYNMIQLLPSSYMQKRTVDLNYQTLRRIYFARRNHKLDEWHTFCDWIKSLPYGEELITYKKPTPKPSIFLTRAHQLIDHMVENGGTTEEILLVVNYIGKLRMIDRFTTSVEDLYKEYNIKELERKYAGTSDNANS